MPTIDCYSVGCNQLSLRLRVYVHFSPLNSKNLRQCRVEKVPSITLTPILSISEQPAARVLLSSPFPMTDPYCNYTVSSKK